MIPITIIGAGPAGLALGYELQRRRLPFRILERHSIGYAWQNHYDRLHLHTLKQVSALPGLPMPADYPEFPSRDQVLAYLRAYARRFDLPIEEGTALHRAVWDGRIWHLETSAGMQATETLVMATGIWSAPRRPPFPGEETFGGMIIHSSAYRNPQAFQGQRTLVVGAGNSGSEIAVNLTEHGVHTAIAVRGGAAFVPRPRSVLWVRLAAWTLRTLPHALTNPFIRRHQFANIGLPLPGGPAIAHYPVVGYELPKAVAAGRITVYGALERFAPGQAIFSDGRSTSVDAVILATGYRPALDPVEHELDLDDSGRPLLDPLGRSLRNPRLFCVGYHYPTTEGWLQALGRVVRRTAAGIVLNWEVR